MMDLPPTFEIRTAYEIWSDSYAFVMQEAGFRQGDPLAKRRIVTSLTVETVERGQFIKPSFNLGCQEVQALFNQLWTAGFRPKDGTGNSGHVEALKYHLEDMRKLVFEGKK